jgi:hypothetical protein
VVEKRIHGPKDLDPQHNQMWNGQCASDLYKTEEPKKEPSSPPRSCPPNHRDPPHAHVPSSVVQIGEVVHLLQAGVLGIRDHQASEATLLLRSSAQSLELLLEQDGGVHVGEDHGGVAAVVDPDALDVVLAHGLLAEAAEVGLLVHEEESALDDGEPRAASMGKGKRLGLRSIRSLLMTWKKSSASLACWKITPAYLLLSS